ncbi:MAG: GIY-YIG nuclease family protein [Sulfurovum sp.]|nr:GIY-YIG nuclease family protein [Sulfurovum sp.]
MSIKRTFTYQSDNLVYAITCQSCNLSYVGETSRSLADRFSEHLADIRHNRSKPVAQHFNSASHTTADVRVKALWQLHGDSFQRKHMESHIIHVPRWTE